jgi:hypothetical protein
MPWRYMGEWWYTPLILNLGTTCSWVVTFTAWQLYPRVKTPLYPLDRRLCRPQSRSGRCSEEKNFDPAGNRTSAVQPVAVPTKLFRLHKKHTHACLINYATSDQELQLPKRLGGARTTDRGLTRFVVYNEAQQEMRHVTYVHTCNIRDCLV